MTHQQTNHISTSQGITPEKQKLLVTLRREFCLPAMLKPKTPRISNMNEGQEERIDGETDIVHNDESEEDDASLNMEYFSLKYSTTQSTE